MNLQRLRTLASLGDANALRRLERLDLRSGVGWLFQSAEPGALQICTCGNRCSPIYHDEYSYGDGYKYGNLFGDGNGYGERYGYGNRQTSANGYWYGSDTGYKPWTGDGFGEGADVL